MPKKKIDPHIESALDHREYQIEDSVVKIWCDGRDYDPSTEAYHPKYSYLIVAPDWRYDGNDIRGGANELPNLTKASQSFFAFLYASQESYEVHLRGAFTDGNFEMFPPHVNEWAQQNSEIIGAHSIALEDQDK